MSTINSLLNPPTRLEERINTLVDLLGNTKFAKGWGNSVRRPLLKAFPDLKSQEEDDRAVNLSAYLVVLQTSLAALLRYPHNERLIANDQYLFSGAIPPVEQLLFQFMISPHLLPKDSWFANAITRYNHENLDKEQSFTLKISDLNHWLGYEFDNFESLKSSQTWYSDINQHPTVFLLFDRKCQEWKEAFQAAERQDHHQEMQRIVKLLQLVWKTTKNLSKDRVVNPLFWHLWIPSVTEFHATAKPSPVLTPRLPFVQIPNHSHGAGPSHSLARANRQYSLRQRAIYRV